MQQQPAQLQLLQQYRQQQEDERAAIESIFESEAEFAKNSWKVWRPIDVVLHLKPAESGSRLGTAAEAYASADLHVACSDRYPDDSPRVELMNVKGIPTDDQTALKQQIQARVAELKGEPVILDVASVVRDFLADKRRLPTGSFHQGMLEKQRKEENEMKRATETIVEREREEIETERERIAEERRRQKEEAADEGRRRRESEAAEAVGEGGGLPMRKIGSRKVFLVQEDYPQRRGLHPMCHEWYGVYERESVLVSEWKLTHNLGRKGEKPMEVDRLRDRLSQLEKEAEKVVELEEMDTALSRIAFVVVNAQALTPTNINIRIYVAQRVPITARNLDNVLNTVKRDESALRRFTLQAVCGLRWLHDQSMVHGALSSSAVFLSDARTFLIADCVVPRLVQQVAEAFRECTGVSRGGGGGEKGVEQRGEGDVREKVTKKMKDLFALGCMLDQLALRSPESSSDSLAAHTNSDLADFVHLCQSAKTADELLDHPFLIQDIQPTGSTTSSVTAFSRASRLIKEFNIFKWLGKGGFGEVTLARNKLDGNDYAVKTIALNPGNESLNRRVTREAKIFSKLNHPNVVRYFSAWTEDMVPDERAEGERPKSAKKHSMVRKASSLRGGGEGDSLLPSRLKGIEARAVEMSEWSTSYRAAGDGASSSSDSSSDDESTDGGAVQLPGRTLFSPKHQVDDSFDIIFEASGAVADDDEDEEAGEDGSECDLGSTTREESVVPKGGATTTGFTRNTESPPTRILYIQMEYCERGTLRHAIDRKLFVDNPKRIWRVFGEMLSGLQYIHKQDMIHRDIKPMNILLDSKEHVKIGDFGLATRQYFSKIAKKGGAEGGVAGGGAEQTGGDRKQSSDLTMDIGTELYMAPELFPERSQHEAAAAAAAEDAPYTNKIDVFSAGIVLFEMFYRPLPPGMERISTLRALKAQAAVPADFGAAFTTHHSTNARRLIECMLAVDPAARPSIDCILEDDRISFNDSEEEIFKKQLIKTVKGRSGRLFKYIMETLVKEEPTAAQAYCYDAAICKEKFSMERESSMGAVIAQLSNLLQLHAFKPLSSPLLRASMHARKETSRTKPVLMVDQAGFPVNLPLDLRENFVRVVARNSVFRLKRYTVGRCFGYGELPGGIHPTERWECSVDAVGPIRASLTLSLSILAVAVAVAAHLVPAHVKCVLRLGHIGLIRAALLHEGHAEEKHESMLHAIAMKRGHDVISKELQATLCAPQTTFAQLRTELKALLKARDDRVREAVKTAIDEMERVVEALKSAEDGTLTRPDIVLDPMLVARPAIFADGLLFQLEVQPPSHKRPSILSQGGRYDHLLKKEQCSNDYVFDSPLAFFGCSFSLDLLVNCGGGQFRPPSVVVCSFSEPLLHEKLQMASLLRKRGVVVDVLHGTVDNDDAKAVEFCSKNAVSFVISFVQRNEVLVKRLDIEEGTVMSPMEAIDFVVPRAASKNLLPPTTVPSTTSSSDTTVLLPLTPTHVKDPPRSMSNTAVTYGVTERLAFNTRKRIEQQITNILTESVNLFKQQTIVSVVVVGAPFDLVKQVAAMLTRSSVPSELTTLFDSLQKSHGRAKEDLESMYAALLPMFSDKTHSCNPIVLFRHQDNLFRYIL